MSAALVITEPATINETWLQIDAAALSLGVSERTIRNRIADRKVATRREEIPGRRDATLVSAADIERLRAEMNRGVITPAIAANGADLNGALAACLAQLAHAQLPAAAPAPKPKPFLTVADAAAYSGLPAGLVRRLIRDGALAAAAFAGVTYVKRADVDRVAFGAEKVAEGV
jgi:hypothetical protein